MNLSSVNLSALEVLRPVLPVPMWQKAAALVLSFVVILAAYFYLIWMPLQDAIARQEVQVEQQRVLLKKNRRIARDLPKKQKEYAQLEKQLKVALNMLPKQSQIPDLLDNVSWAGKDSGLEFSAFKPQGEVAKQIYAEVPVSVNMSGSYRQLLTFLKRVGEMPRIVNVNSLSLTRAKGSDEALSISGKAVTYRFVEGKPNNKRPNNRNRRR